MRTTTTHDDDDLLTPREVSRMLGIGLRTLDKYTANGVLRCLYLPSGHRRFRRSDVLALLSSRESA